MASMCINQKDNNYQSHHHYNHVTNTNNNSSLMQQKQQITKQAFAANQKQHPLASAPSKVLTSSNVHNIQPLTTNYMVINKKRYSYGMLPYGLDQLPSVARRNARERNRVKQVNNGFANLRQHIPQTVITALSHGGRGATKKLSKVDTLRIAVEYIRGLQTLLDSTHSSITTTNTINNSTDFTDDCSSDINSYECSSVNSLDDNSPNYQISPTLTTSHSPLDIPINSSKKFLQSVKLEDSDDTEFKLNSFEQVDDEELLDYISTWQDE